ncbi:hypothetical protein [Nonomuraea sp. LPB2021202275-12-8]|uniref:hypothetical protein n=1 Tax=Nonomuraea sp. LPB2021202275-12-8 TaxID=3120159 RepID=UPI00300C406E
MGSRTAISAGVLVVALAAIPLAAPPAAALAADCERGGGLLSGVTDGLCSAVEAVTGTVDTLTGGLTKPVTKGLDETTDTVLGKVGEAVPTTRSTSPPPSSAKPTPSAKPKRTLLPETLGEVCLPVLACDDQGELDVLTPTPTAGPKQSRRPTPTPSDPRRERGGDRDARDEVVGLPTDAPTPPDNRPHTMDNEEPIVEPKADPDDLRIDLLWPNPFAEELAVPVRKQRIVRPSTPASDVVGTALTIILLATAVLATRIVQQRRQRSERPDSIPFEPARPGNGRQRLA